MSLSPQDLRYGLRTLLKSPGFTVVALLTLALGIGANTAMFSVVNAVLLQPLPYPQPDRLVSVWETFPMPSGRGSGTLCVERLRVWQREEESPFEALGVYDSASRTLIQGGREERYTGTRVTAEVLGMLGVKPALGRVFGPGEDRPGQDRVIVLSHGLWTRAFGADPEIIGRKLTIKEGDVTVIGVMPPRFRFPFTSDSQFWAPLVLKPAGAEDHSMHTYTGIARMKRGTTLEQAQRRMDTITARLEQKQDPKEARGVLLLDLLDGQVSSVRPNLLMLFGAVTLVLLIACANISNLLLARGAQRSAEVTIRAALGASRGRLLRQLFTENLVLALGGAGLGVLLSLFLVDLVRLAPVSLPRGEQIRVDGWVLTFSAGLAIFTSVLFGLAPALQGSRVSLASTLRESAGRGGARRGARGMLVSIEVALTITLLVGAGLLLRSLWRLQSVDAGFRPASILSMRLSPPQARLRSLDTSNAFFDEVLERVAAVPGAIAAGLISRLPPNDSGTNGNFTILDQPAPPRGQEPFAEIRFVSSNYFQTMGIALKRGRFFTPADRKGSLPVVIVNDALARRYWPDADPIGGRIKLDEVVFTVAGVAGNARNLGLGQQPFPEYYIAESQNPWADWIPDMYLVVRTAVEPNVLISAVRSEIARVDPGPVVFDVRTMEQRFSSATAFPRFRALLIGAFAGMALLLALIGLYGVLAYEVSRQTRDIGVRMALGAAPSQVLGGVLARGLWLSTTGVAAGIVGSLALGRVVARFLFETSPTDVLTYIAVSGLVIVVSLLATYLPARRATRIDPMAALRYE